MNVKYINLIQRHTHFYQNIYFQKALKLILSNFKLKNFPGVGASGPLFLLGGIPARSPGKGEAPKQFEAQGAIHPKPGSALEWEFSREQL